MSACPRLGKLFGGCRFEARYSKGAASMAGLEGFSGPPDTLVAMGEKTRAVTYIGDICTRCGEWRQRPEAKS